MVGGRNEEGGEGKSGRKRGKRRVGEKENWTKGRKVGQYPDDHQGSYNEVIEVTTEVLFFEDHEERITPTLVFTRLDEFILDSILLMGSTRPYSDGRRGQTKKP